MGGEVYVQGVSVRKGVCVTETYTPPPWTDRHLGKHYLPATLFAARKYLRIQFEALLFSKGGILELTTENALL